MSNIMNATKNIKKTPRGPLAETLAKLDEMWCDTCRGYRDLETGLELPSWLAWDESSDYRCLCKNTYTETDL
jgi:hypothetical protein